MKNTLFCLTLFGVLLTTSSPSHAYIGPGMGGGVVVAVLGILGAFVVGLFGIVYFPIKRALKNKAKKKKEALDVENNLNETDVNQVTDVAQNRSSDEK